jgi:3-hydroxyacyl-[acyl-carrier-protein] dehydratase
MRFLLFDRILEVVPGERIRGVKCVTLSEEYLRGHYTRSPRVPGPLVIEAQIQLLAWCAITAHDFRHSLVLSVLEDVEVPADLSPGHRIDLFGELHGTNPRGSMGTAWAEIDGERIASVGRVLYAHGPSPDPDALREQFRTYGGTL